MDFVRLRAVARKEWIQLRRDTRSMLLAFVLPLFMLLFFGYAITWDVRDIPLAVLDQDRTHESRALVDVLVASGYFSVAEELDAAATLDERLVADDVIGALWIPPGYARALLAPERTAEVQLLVDGSDANTATIALNYADAIVVRHGARMIAGRRVEPPVHLETRTWYNPDLESRHMIVPGLIAVIMSIIAAMLTALTIAREWERGTMEQLAATPVGRFELVLGKLLPYVAIGLCDVAVTVVAGWLVFDTPVRGSVPLLAALTLLFLIGALGLGIFISAAIKSQVLAMQIAMVVTYLPAVLLSGFVFDIASMPAVLRTITMLVPARYYVSVTRGIFLKDVGLEVLWPQAALMLLYAAIGLGLATRAFRKELET